MAPINLAQIGYENYYQMLSDKVRMNAYRAAIFKKVKPGDTVIDLGSGTGILGIWALKAGAAKVYSIEKSDAIHLAKEIAQANGLSDKIVFLQESSKDVQLPEKADVLLSETLGSFAVDENTLEFTIDARDRLLKPQGTMIPFQLDLFAAPIDSPAIYDKIALWKNIPDIDFSPAFELFSKKIMIETVENKNLLASAQQMASIDLRNCTEDIISGRQYFQLEKPGTIHGVAGWFHAHLTDEITIKTSPNNTETHWKQAFFPFKETVNIIKGDVLDWSFTIEKSNSDIDATHISYASRCTQIKNEIPAD